MKKKVIAILIGVLILVCAGAIIAALTTPEESDPVVYEFDQNTGILTFIIVDDNHVLRTVDLENQVISGLSVPDYDERSREIAFNINEIAPKQYEGIRIITTAPDGGFNANYRVFRGDASQEVTVKREILGEGPERETFPYTFQS